MQTFSLVVAPVGQCSTSMTPSLAENSVPLPYLGHMHDSIRIQKQSLNVKLPKARKGLAPGRPAWPGMSLNPKPSVTGSLVSGGVFQPTVTTSVAPVTTSKALVPSSFLFLLVRHLLLLAWHLLLLASYSNVVFCKLVVHFV